MKRITLDEMKKIEFEILLHIKEICEKNSLNYYLAYGTLIGAIRHKGFIPWDDDIDIIMPREDFLKLVDIFKTDENNRYKLICFNNNEKFTAPLAKIVDTRTLLQQNYGFIEKVDLGVYVDIFIIDGAPDEYEEALLYYNKAYDLYMKWAKSDTMMFTPGRNRIGSFLFWMRTLPYKFFGIRYWIEKMYKYNSQLSFYSQKYVSVLEAGTKNPTRNVWLQQDFGDGIEVEFEGEYFKAPSNYDAILSVEYGDYMKLPPIEQRVSHHLTNVFWKYK